MNPSSTLVAPSADLDPAFNWRHIARLFLTSRFLDDLEESRLLPEKKILYQFSARGHELGQILLGSLLTEAHDAASGYYRSRPLLLTLGLTPADALAGGMARSGGVSDGRDIGAVYNLPNPGGAMVLPMAGGVGTQYTPTAGWAHAIVYHRDTLREESWRRSIAVALGGDGSVATNGFWSALNIATTQRLPMLFYIEDNGFGLSVPSTVQTPGGNIAANLGSFGELYLREGDGADPLDAARCLRDAVARVRDGQGPALVRLTVPRLCGHSGQDTQAYKSAELVARERAHDPLLRFKAHLVPAVFSEREWSELERSVQAEIDAALENALSRPEPEAASVRRYVFAEDHFRPTPAVVREPARLNMLTAIRRTLEHELEINPKVLVFGEDVGPKGGVHAATMGLQEMFGGDRVFDTSLSEEGIVGGAVGMAIAGLRPVAEIQFRKYADPGTEQLNDCGTIRWRTANRFAAPVVVRIPGGFAKCGDPWHSVSNEVFFAHAIGWQAMMPSNAEDAVGLLRAALRSANPTIFFEHRAMLDASWARRPYPGDDFLIPPGVARRVLEGSALTLVTWGAMVERSVRAAEKTGASAEILDLRTISPWDRPAVLASVEKTRRCLIVHEDTLTAGFGAEVAAVVAQEAFLNLDAPVTRLAVPDLPLPYNIGLMNAVLPGVDQIAAKIEELLAF
ncbi:MAG TPA: transketolase C-terminal domain-containing protein [Bryobacteraceae bacterium]|nr:transketolase C-terminal domain-containing protein [Bryobacteraceae bacterium]